MRVSLNKSNVASLFLVSVIGSLANVNASECRSIYRQNSKSFGVFIKKNNCSQDTHISRGTRLELIPRGRLWFKSTPSDYVESEFQLICQNRSSNKVQLEFSDMLSPWLSLAKLNNCSGWVDNKLSCGSADSGEKGIYCVLAPIKTIPDIDQNQIKRTTSIKMRTIKGSVEKIPYKNVDKSILLKVINADLQLCKKLNQITQTLEIKWTVEPNQNISIVEMTRSEKLIDECAKAVVSTFIYPEFSEKTTFKSTF